MICIINLNKLLSVLKEKNVPVSRIKHDKVVGGSTYDILLRSIREGATSDGITLKTINALCKYLNCQPSDIMEYIPDE